MRRYEMVRCDSEQTYKRKKYLHKNNLIVKLTLPTHNWALLTMHSNVINL